MLVARWKMTSRNGAGVQGERRAQIVEEMEPGCEVKFIPNDDGLIRFTILEKPSGKVLLARSASWEPERLARLSGQELRDLIALLSVGKMGNVGKPG
jgi:hypothetical protein